jgi:ABC-type multidrug transport system fused ATPase/permease subunit
MPETLRSSTSPAFFCRALGAFFEEDGAKSPGIRVPWLFAVSTLVQAGAHGVLASCAGLLGQALVGRQFVAAGAFVDSPPVLFPPLVLCAAGFSAAVVKTAAGALGIYEQKRAAFRAGNSVRRAITDAILRAGQAGPAARTHAAIAVQLRDVERGVDEGVFAAIRAVAHLVPLAIVLITLSSHLALISFAVLAPFAIVLGRVRRRLRAGHGRASRLAEQLHAGVDELVRHLDLWRTYGAGGRVRRALAVAGEQAGLAAARADAARAAISGSNEALAALALLVAVALVERGGLPLGRGSLVAFAAVFFLMYRPLRDLGEARIAVERGAHALEALDRLRAQVEGDTPMHTPVGTPHTPAWGLERLVVRRLAVVRGDHATPEVSLDAGPGEIVALVGPTGAGKTSLLRALLGLERDVAGEIHYGERDLGRAGVGPAERPFAWVPQEAAIVSGTLAENVALGAPETAAGEAAARAALATIGAGSLEGRADDHLAAGGPELSGGERQWVAIARALASGLPVLLLDEPTSGLDALSQARVLEALVAVRGGRTVILVTHRPEPLAIADRVVRLGTQHVSGAARPSVPAGPRGTLPQ